MKLFLTRRFVFYTSLAIAILLLVSLAIFWPIKSTLARTGYSIFVFLVLFFLLTMIRERIEFEAERARADQARKILRIAEATLPFLRQGLNLSSAQKIAEVMLHEMRAIAVSVTDRKRILAFAGMGSDHHYPGKRIITQATKEALASGTITLVRSQEDIGCPNPNCPLKAAIIVPIRHDSRVEGTLKFYYSQPDQIAESEIALCEGLGHLLETQLELSQLQRLETLACQSELKALQSQVNPHFFFNVLNTVISYCRSDPLEARKILLDFSNFFRATIEHGEESLITLDAELNYLTAYLELEKARFGDRLQYSISVSRRARAWHVPPFILQPLVENAIVHGFPPNRTLFIEIRDRVTENARVIEVRDNGTGIKRELVDSVLKKGTGSGLGVGMSLVNERLRLLFGDEYGLRIESRPSDGTVVQVLMPKRIRAKL